MTKTLVFCEKAHSKRDIAITVSFASALFLSACGSSGGNSDGGPCPAGQVLRYESPGCGAAATPVCGSSEQDACYRAVCGCQGQTISRCDYAPEPFSAFGACPMPDAGVDLAVDRANDIGIDEQDVGVDGPIVCRGPSPYYGPTSVFSVLPNDTPPAPTACAAACGDSAWPGSMAPNIDIALPYGACAADTPACSTLASVPCVCGPGSGPTDAFNCSCEGGTWICRIRSLGTALCMPCPDANVSQIDQSPVSDGPQNAEVANQ